MTAFQQGWNLGPKLTADGTLGPKTSAALNLSAARKRQRKSTASKHFSFAEFTCKCGGKHSSCRRIVVRRELLQSLEKYRAAISRPVAIASGYRCPKHNASLPNAAKKSQHMQGAAADIPKVLTLNQVRNLRAFAGIGYSRGSKKVSHVDRRDLSSLHGDATVNSPDEWVYNN